MEFFHYKFLAQIFSYPDLTLDERVKVVINKLSSGYKYSKAVINLKKFHKLLPCKNLSAMEELYTRSFDVQSATTLDIGYILFSDDYKRGEMLVLLNQECKKAKVNCGCELSDHLPNILKLITASKDQKFLNELVKIFLAPALREMIKEFDFNRLKKREEFYKKQYKTLIDLDSDIDRAILYSYALKSVYSVLEVDFDVSVEKQTVCSSDFLSSLKREFDTEDNQENVNSTV